MVSPTDGRGLGGRVKVKVLVDTRWPRGLDAPALFGIGSLWRLYLRRSGSAVIGCFFRNFLGAWSFDLNLRSSGRLDGTSSFDLRAETSAVVDVSGVDLLVTVFFRGVNKCFQMGRTRLKEIEFFIGHGS